MDVPYKAADAQRLKLCEKQARGEDGDPERLEGPLKHTGRI